VITHVASLDLEDRMVSLTDAARAELDNYFADKQKAPIRVYLNKGSCCGPSLTLALDEAREEDEVFDLGGYTFVVEKELMTLATPITVDMTDYGFAVSSSLKLEGGTCGSGSCGSGGGCGGGSCS
jgi:iron-sulfur cluster assembly protein